MRNCAVVFLILWVFSGCKEESPRPEITTVTPAKVKLVFPLKNSECNVGTDSAGTESTLRFEWQFEGEATEYQMLITNLLTDDQSSFSTPNDTISVALPRATPYAWYVVAKSDVSDTSEVWKFYNSGDGITSHVPFPAEILFPGMSASVTAASGTITLEWEGSDIDDDITGYDIHFGTDNPPPLIAENVLQSELANVSVTSGSIYFWSVTAKDAYGNRSETGIFQFKLE